MKIESGSPAGVGLPVLLGEAGSMAVQGNRDAAGGIAGLEKGSLRHILNNTIDTIEENKTQIFDIYETARMEVESNKKLLESVKRQTQETIDRVDDLARREKLEKQHLVQVSSNFADYSEADIRASYESVTNVQVELAVERDKEKRLREQRDKLELRMRHLHGMLKQAEHLTMAIGSVLSYLSSQIGGVVWQIEAAQKEKFAGARIIKAQEDERYRISRELHDGVAQDLANLIFQTSICEKLVDRDPEEAKRNIQGLRQGIRECIAGVRQVIFDMRPMALDDQGLAPAIHQLCGNLADRGLVAVDYDWDGEEYALPKHVEIAAFRIVQEALNNVAHHSGVRKAKVRVHFTPAAINICVEDRGKGFDPEALAEERTAMGQDEESMEGDEPQGHFGIMSMKERAKLIGAEIGVSSAPGQGTKIHLRIPNRMAALDKGMGKS